ncbi:hypothetical protein E2C01_075785 [Portunus trituberculatus]|uniref:Uncharacterized protein n=1 Tax=Portunus trituberculatus TaxID=210409 RepID=A0A5B7IK24_PORTR|nr:hypothetical protein [Portunus trituberculatus]
MAGSRALRSHSPLDIFPSDISTLETVPLSSLYRASPDLPQLRAPCPQRSVLPLKHASSEPYQEDHNAGTPPSRSHLHINVASPPSSSPSPITTSPLNSPLPKAAIPAGSKVKLLPLPRH